MRVGPTTPIVPEAFAEPVVLPNGAAIMVASHIPETGFSCPIVTRTASGVTAVCRRSASSSVSRSRAS